MRGATVVTVVVEIVVTGGMKMKELQWESTAARSFDAVTAANILLSSEHITLLILSVVVRGWIGARKRGEFGLQRIRVGVGGVRHKIKKWV